MKNLHDLLAQPSASSFVLHHKDNALTLNELKTCVVQRAKVLADKLATTTPTNAPRVLIFQNKHIDWVVNWLAISQVNAVSVIANSLFKPHQLAHLINDSQCQLIITDTNLKPILEQALAKIKHSVEGIYCNEQWQSIKPEVCVTEPSPPTLACLLYTSGSTGKPKGVMLSHSNMLLGAQSVAQYVGIKNDDHILSVLPFSFDYGLNQLTSALWAGAQLTLHDFLLPNDVVKQCAKRVITGLAGIPPLWARLSNARWENAGHTLRWFTNSGGHMHKTVLDTLQTHFPNARPFLMYGLTEAFRSSYLDPEKIGHKPNSIGQAIPHAELLVLNDELKPCKKGEHGQLAHLGPLVAMGYWRRQEDTEKRFITLADAKGELQPAVLSGDVVYQDDDGDLFFVSRNDDQIKVSGYRISKDDIEEVLYAHPSVAQALVFGIPDQERGQAIIALVQLHDEYTDTSALAQHCQQQLPSVMLPQLYCVNEIQYTASGKLDRTHMQQTFLTTHRTTEATP